MEPRSDGEESGGWPTSSDRDFNKLPCLRCLGALPLVILTESSYESSVPEESRLVTDFFPSKISSVSRDCIDDCDNLD